MRYYDLSISGPNVLNGRGIRFTSHPNGPLSAPDPGALDIEFDAQVAPMGVSYNPGGAAFSIRGIPMDYISQSNQWGKSGDQPGANFILQGGMGKGLPLSNPNQRGILLAGEIIQSFGNWVGTEMSLTFIVQGIADFSKNQPGNFTFSWPANQDLQQPLTSFLTNLYPNATVNYNVQKQITFSQDINHACDSLTLFSAWLNNQTANYNGDTSFQGVHIYLTRGNILVTDHGQSGQSIGINFTDLIGQPTWYAQNQIAVSLVMRGDIQVGDTVTLPANMSNNAGFVISTPQQYASQINYKKTFSGSFIVTSVRHIGSFRTPDSRQWITVLYCSVVSNV